jgi:hypothetical protein
VFAELLMRACLFRKSRAKQIGSNGAKFTPKKCTLNVVCTLCIQDDMLIIFSIFLSASLCTILHMYFVSFYSTYL